MAGCSEAEALGILGYIWLWAVNDNADSDGRLMDTDRESLSKVFATAISDDLDRLKVVDALVESGWIEETGGVLFIHDWDEHQKPWVDKVKDRERAKIRKREERERKRQIEALTHPPASSPPMQQTADPPEPAPGPPAEPAEPKAAKAPAKKSDDQYGEGFRRFWEAYPKKRDKATAYKKYQARIKDGYSPEELIGAAEEYAKECQREHREEKYIKMAKTFLGDNMPFADYVPKKKDPRNDPHSPYYNPFAEYGEEDPYAEWGEPTDGKD